MLSPRRYSSSDRRACLDILLGNSPEFFAAGDDEKFSAFLDQLPGPYFVLEEGRQIVACGGWAMDSRDVAVLTWGIVRRDAQRRGIGRELLHMRVGDVRLNSTARLVRLRTIPKVQPFFVREGFTVVGIAPDGFGAGFDCVTMELPLLGY